jgi:hypothetical protein
MYYFLNPKSKIQNPKSLTLYKTKLKIIVRVQKPLQIFP